MSPSVAPVDTAQQSQEALLLHSALMQISEDKREVLVLTASRTLSTKRLLSCWAATVKTRVHRALQVALRRIFQQLESGKTFCVLRNGREDGLLRGVL